MEREAELRNVLLDIVGIGVLRIRASGWDGLAENCALEADHIHNLPRLIQDPKTDLLLYYWNVERTSYIEKARSPQGFELAWERLAAILSI